MWNILLTLASLGIFRTKYLYEDNGNKLRFFQSNRTLSISVENNLRSPTVTVCNSSPMIPGNTSECDGVIGLFTAHSGNFVAIILNYSDCSQIAPGVRKITEIGLMRLTSAKAETIKDSYDWELHSLRRVLTRHSFYYSTSNYDISRTAQANAIISQKQKFIEMCDDRFFWNQNWAQSILSANAKEFIVPIVNAWSSTVSLLDDNGNPQHSLTLISRRSRFRQGLRYIKRGIDESGNVGNFVETEQVLHRIDGPLCSFVQVRGSLPLFWEQDKLWKLKPRLRLLSGMESTAQSLKMHIADLARNYGALETSKMQQNNKSSLITFLNLIDKTGPQWTLGAQLSLILSNNTANQSKDSLLHYNRNFPTSELFNLNCAGRSEVINNVNVRYVWFDYHHNLKFNGMKKLDILGKSLKSELLVTSDSRNNKYSGNYFEINGTIVRQLQNGVIRTNCIDCLDRTNIIQAYFAKIVLCAQLNNFNRSVRHQDDFQNQKSIDGILGQENLANFRKLWTSHGDALSMLYTGTKAMKRDVTRYGARTKIGILTDSLTSMKRYFNGIFADKFLQGGVDILLGK